MVEQLAAAEHAFGVRHQKVQQFEFAAAAFYIRPVRRDALGFRIQLQPACRTPRIARRRTSQPRMNTRHQFARRKRLGQVIVRALCKAQFFVGIFAACGEQDNRQGGGGGLAAQFGNPRHTVAIGQHPVQHHQIGQAGAQDVGSSLHILRAAHLKAGFLQVECNQRLNRQFVFHHQNPCFIHKPAALLPAAF